jgi:uncharacterized protein (TIGR02996 family)
MSVDAELIAAITAAPDDDAPRLVYADHLMQQGDPRGEFIALQCRLAAADAADQPTDPAVIAREKELREAHAATWAIGLTAIVPAGYEFRRGFVEHVTAWSESDIAHFVPEPVEDPPPLYRPAIEEPHDRLGDIVAAAPLVNGLTTRGDAILCTITDGWKPLRSVTLQQPRAGVDRIQAFLAHPALARLRRLQLTCVEVDDDRARAWLGSTQPLEHLGMVGGWHVSLAPTRNLAELIVENPALHGLTSLHLGNFALRDLKPLAELRHLERLALHRAMVTAHEIEKLLPALPNLEMLEIDDDDEQLGLLDVEALLAATPKLRRLAIRNSLLGFAGAKVLASSPHTTALRRIELEQCGLDSAATRLLVDSPHLRGVGWWRILEDNLDPTHADALAKRRTLHYQPPPPTYPPTVMDSLPKNKIGAIKNYRTLTRAGLADSKMAVETIVEEIWREPGYNNYRAIPRWVRP